MPPFEFNSSNCANSNFRELRPQEKLCAENQLNLLSVGGPHERFTPREVFADAGATFSGFAARAALTRLPGVVGACTRLTVPFVAAGLSRDLIATGTIGDSKNWLIGAGFYGATRLLLASSEMSLNKTLPEVWGKRVPLAESKQMLSNRLAQLEAVTSRSGDSPASFAVKQEIALLKGTPSSIGPRIERQLTPADELAKKYATLPDRNIDIYFGKHSGAVGLHPPIHKPEMSAELNAELQGMESLLASRYAGTSNMAVLELGPHISTSVARTFKGRLSSYTAVEAQATALAAQKEALAREGIHSVVPLNADMCHLPIASATQDLVVASRNGVLVSGHPVEMEKALAEISRVLKPQGELVVQPWQFVTQPSRYLRGDKLYMSPWKAVKQESSDLLLSRFKIVDFRPFQSSAEKYLLVLKKRS